MTGTTYLVRGETAVIHQNTVPLRINGEAAPNPNPMLENRALLFVIDGGGRHSFGFFVSAPRREHTVAGNQEDDTVVVVPFDKESGRFDSETAYEFPDDGLSVDQNNTLLVGKYPEYMQISQHEDTFLVSNGERNRNLLLAATEAHVFADPDNWAFK
jgi:hypothetical protein